MRLIPHVRVAVLAALLPGMVGCAAKAAFDLATAPVRMGARAVDTTADAYDRLTVSQSERDQKRGREIRQREERLGRLSREYGRARMRCDDGDDRACERAYGLRRELDALSPRVPYEGD
ncbi:hypothetical protein [Novosphingobium cyanobacteriorum]|uniref:Lipoprotein n=1 Tax=Novosphingobium cyanobacteriorum TaxID=3024215 RepID=A0ABT6CIW2_9SPHN|nr:hypothetical protein [Novosphingobium cyanobacteriorum]MDF8333015.1 hypothetical protein [Novosphingobium cyanobacteriorum]